MLSADAQTLNFDLIKLECSDERRKDDVEYKLISNDAQLACNLLISLAGKTVSVSGKYVKLKFIIINKKLINPNKYFNCYLSSTK